MTKTEHYQLSQWDPNDQVKRTDFNEDNAKLDAALAAKAESTSVNAALAELRATDAKKADSSSVDSRFDTQDGRLTALEGRLEAIVGTYTGDGEPSHVISLGVTPKLVLVEFPDGTRSRRGGMAVTGAPMIYSGDIGIEIVDGGFRVTLVNYVEMNVLDAKYYYLALC